MLWNEYCRGWTKCNDIPTLEYQVPHQLQELTWDILKFQWLMMWYNNTTYASQSNPTCQTWRCVAGALSHSDKVQQLYHHHHTWWPAATQQPIALQEYPAPARFCTIPYRWLKIGSKNTLFYFKSQNIILIEIISGHGYSSAAISQWIGAFGFNIPCCGYIVLMCL